MKFKWPSKALRQKRLVERGVSWQLVFLWWPTRTSEDHVEWLTTVARIFKDAYLGRRAGYLYGPVTNALTQPGTTKVDNNVAQQPAGAGNHLFVPSVWTPGAIGTLKGNGVLGAPAGGAAIQSRLGQSAIDNSQAVHAQGLTNVGASAYGGQHPPTP